MQYGQMQWNVMFALFEEYFHVSIFNCLKQKWFYAYGCNACMLCVSTDNWETKLKGKTPGQGIVLCAFSPRIVLRFFELGVPKSHGGISEFCHNNGLTIIRQPFTSASLLGGFVLTKRDVYLESQCKHQSLKRF